MTNIPAITADYRLIGDTPYAVWDAELRRVGSPMLPSAKDTYAAAQPHTALFLAQAWLENQYKTTGHIIKAHHNNPLSIRPPVVNKPGPFASGVITAPDGGQFETYRSDADCAREWKRRLFDEADTYKGGVYGRAKTLADMLAVYAPSGDVHPVTGKDNADIGYARTVTAMLTRFAEMEKAMADSVAQQIVDELTNIVVSPGKGGSNAGATEYAPLLPLTYLDDADPKTLIVRETGNVFFRVNANVEAIRPTPRYQHAGGGDARRGPDMQPGDEAYIEWAWIEPSGVLWLYSDWGTRFHGPDFVRMDGAPIVPPDTDPGNVPTKPDPPKPTPPTPGTVTKDNYRQVADPATLLPPLIWRGSPNFFPNRSGVRPVSIFYHITDDMNLNNVLGWFQNARSQASSHFVIARDGTVYQMVSSKDGSWTNGDVNRPRTDIPWLNEVVAKRHNLNNYTITYEFIGTPSNPPTDAQYVAAIKLSRYFCHPKVFGINPNRSHQNRHADANSVSRSYCPGPRFDLERIIRELGGDPAKVA